MNDSFERFISEIEVSSREAELAKLLASKASAQEEVREAAADDSVLNDEVVVNIATVATEELLKKASDCSKELTDCEKELHHHSNSLSAMSSQLPSDKEWVKPLLEKGKKIAAECSEVDSSMDVLQDALSKASELHAEAKRRNQEAAASFSMTDLVMEINMVIDQRKINADLVAENEALWGLVEDLNRDLEHAEAEAQREEEDYRKRAEEHEKVKALLAEVGPKCASRAEALSKATEEHKRLEKELSEAQAKAQKRMEQEKVANTQLEKALAEKANFEAKMEAELTRYSEVAQRAMDEIEDLERAMAETKVIGDRKIAEILEKKEAYSAEWAEFQKELEEVSAIRRQCIDEEAAVTMFDDDMEDVEKQIETRKAELQKKKNEKELFANEKADKLQNKIREIEELEAELVANEALLNDEAAVLKEKMVALEKTCVDLKKESAALCKKAKAFEDNFRRAQIVAGREAVSGENRSNKSGSGARPTNKNARMPAPRSSRGSNKPPSKKVVRKNDSLFNNTSNKSSLGSAIRSNTNQLPPPPRKIVRQNDSLFGNDSKDNSSFDLSFGSAIVESNAPPPPAQFLNTPPPAASRDSTIHIDPSQFTTSTPMSKKGTASALPPVSKSQPVPRAARARRGGKK